MSYNIILAPQAQKFLQKLPDKEFDLIETALMEISANPHQGKALVKNLKGFWSWRVTKYRIIYEIHDEQIQIHVIRIDLRKKVYK